MIKFYFSLMLMTGLCNVAMAEASPDISPSAVFTFKAEGSLSVADIGDGVWWTPELNETSITEVLRDLNEWNVPNLYLDVFRSGRTLYPSSIFPQREAADQRDWLQYIIAQAHQQNIRVHAWVQVVCWQDADAEVSTSHPLLIQNPDWVELTADGLADDAKTSAIYVSPGIPAVREALVAMASEIGKYPIDGFNLDSVHYNPAVDMGYNALATREFRMTEGADPAGLKRDRDRDSLWMKWVAFREDRLTSVVQQMGGAAREAATLDGRRILVSANVQPNYEETRGINRRYQHWGQWLDDEIIDASIPQCFSSELPSLEQQLWQVRSVHMGSGIACIPGLDLRSDSATAHPSLKEQKRLLHNAGFRYSTVLDYSALKHEMTKPVKNEKSDGGGFWNFFGDKPDHDADN